MWAERDKGNQRKIRRSLRLDMLSALLPAGTVAVEANDLAAPPSLLPEEEAALGDVAERRRHDFTLGRSCAREALRRMGRGQAPILVDERRSPLWPHGVTGSITHCDGYAAAAVAACATAASVGIDAERHRPLPPRVRSSIMLPSEQAAAARSGRGVAWDAVVFSAKEAVYKAWFPIARRWLGFEDAEIELRPDGTFTGTILVPGPLSSMNGQYGVEGELVAAAVVVPAAYGVDTASDAISA